MQITRAQLGMHNIYNNPLPIQGGNGKFTDSVRRGATNLVNANQYIKDNKLISRGAAGLSAAGLDGYLNARTGGYYGKATDLATSHGYGKKKKRRKSTKKTNKKR